MKNLIIIIFAVFSVSIQSQWLSDTRLTNDPNASHLGKRKCLSTSNDFIHIVWFDYRDGNSEIYYKRSSNKGNSWGSDTRITVNNAKSWYPSVASSGSNVFVSWVDERDGNDRVYFKRSNDDGASWLPEIPVSDNASLATLPEISVLGNVVVIVWASLSGSTYSIRCKRSPDSGFSWSPEIILNSGSYTALSSIAGNNSDFFASWVDNKDGNEEIYFSISTDYGINWSSGLRISNNAARSTFPSINTSGYYVYITWVDERDGNKEIYFKSSYNKGLNWGGEQRLTDNSSESSYPYMAVYDDAIHLVWEDYRNGTDNSEIYYKSSTNRGGNWGSDVRLTNFSSHSLYPCIGVSGSNLHCIWSDFRNGPQPEIYYKKNPTGNPIGIQQISTEVPAGFELSQNYPNPFNPTTNIKISLPESEFVNLTVYDIVGREVAVLVNDKLNTGIYNVDFNASHLASGTYFYRLTAGSFTEVKKMMLVK